MADLFKCKSVGPAAVPVPSSGGSGLKILALDPATHCGFAHSTGPSGTWDMSVRRDESGGMKLIRLRGKLNEIKRDVGVDLVVFEAARNVMPKMQGALVVQSELQSVIKVWCEDNQVEYRGFSPTEIKKFAANNGNASKELMIELACKRWPEKRKRVEVPVKGGKKTAKGKREMTTILTIDDNEADALWLLAFFQSQI